MATVINGNRASNMIAFVDQYSLNADKAFDKIMLTIKNLSKNNFKGFDSITVLAKQLENNHKTIDTLDSLLQNYKTQYSLSNLLDEKYKSPLQLKEIQNKITQTESDLTAAKQKEYDLMLELKQKYISWYNNFNYDNHKKDMLSDMEKLNKNNSLLPIIKPLANFVTIPDDLENKHNLKEVYNMLANFENWYK